MCLLGAVRIGDFNTIGSYCSIGGEPQDISYWGTATRVEIGDRNTIGDRVTIHRASEKGDGLTQIGNDNHILEGAHIAHDCKLADRIVVGVLAMIGGHARIESDVVISEKVGVHQFATVGRNSFIDEQSKITQDVPCYMRVSGNPSRVCGINGRKLAKDGISGRSRASLRAAHQLIYVARVTLGQATEILDVRGVLTPEVGDLLEFLEDQQLGRMGRGRERLRG